MNTYNRLNTNIHHYPFGSVMPGRSYSSSDYRYGFNGKESDDEVKGSKNSYDFGARMYDNRLGKFLSIDPMVDKFPHEAPYIFGGNNPILNIDVDGLFKIPIHDYITTSVLNELGLNSTFFRWDIRFGNTIEADLLGASSDYHFDGRSSFGEIQDVWASLNKKINSTSIGNLEYGGSNTRMLGVLLHNVQDFYAHSNYVELYLDYYMKNNDGQLPEIGKIPTYQDVMDDSQYEGFVEGYLKDNLKTGEFHLGSWLFGQDAKQTNKNGDVHHDELAKDNLEMGKTVVGVNSELNTHNAATAVAKKHTKQIVKKKIDKKNGG